MKTELTNLLAIAIKKASHNVIRDFNEINFLVNNYKSSLNFAFNSNIKAQETLFEDLQKIKPKYSFIFNSLSRKNNKDQSNFFIINGILGIENFARGIPYFCISVALERDSQIIASVIFNPITNELFYAEKNNGAFYNNRKIRKSTYHMENSSASIMIASDVQYIKDSTSIENNIYINNCKSLDLCYLAASKINGCYYKEKSNSYDLEPAILIANESGYDIKMNVTKSKNNNIINELSN